MRTGPGPDITSTGDPRITRCGAVLRHLKLDELPQLWNVLRGDMSLVGPRPELPRWVARHPDEFARAHQVRPGVTGVSSLRYRDEAAALSALVRTGAASSLDEAYDRVLLPAKLALDLDYLERRTAASDLRVLAATLWAVALRRDPEGLLRSSGSTRLHEAAA